MKVLATILACVLMIGALAGCGNNTDTPVEIEEGSTPAGGNVLDNVASAVGGAASAVGNAIGEALSGNVTGKIGETYTTKWFAFQIDSIEFVEEYEGEVADDGYDMIDVVCTVTGLWEPEPVPMIRDDFYIQGTGIDEDVISWSPWHDSMWPDFFEVELDDSVTYHMIFEVPTDSSDLKLMYTEIDESGETFATFTININR